MTEDDFDHPPLGFFDRLAASALFVAFLVLLCVVSPIVLGLIGLWDAGSRLLAQVRR